jgi:hypothetical protein
MNKKIVVAIIVIIVLLVAFFSFNYITNKHFRSPEFTQNAPDVAPLSSTDELSGDQRIFNDEQRGIEFKYPSNLSRSFGGTALPSNLNSQIILLKNSNGTPNISDIQLWITPNQSSLVNYITQVMGDKDFAASDEIIGGVSAKRLVIKGQLFAEGSQVFFVKDGYGYRWIAYKARDVDGGLNMIPILNNILSTFKFTK